MAITPAPGGSRAARPSILTVAAAAVLTALTLYLLVVGKPILMPFVIALLAANLITALAAVTRRIRIGQQVIPQAVRIIIAVAIVLLLAWLAIGLVTGSVGRMTATLPLYEHNLRQAASRIGDRLGMDLLSRVQVVLEGVNLARVLRGLARGVTGILAGVGTVAIYVVFLLLERRTFDKKLASVFANAGHEAGVRQVLARIGRQIQTYVWYKTLFSIVTGVASYMVMKAVGLDFAEFWAVLIFGLNYIPYIGAWLGVIFPTVLALVQFENVTPFLIVVVGLAAIQFTLGSILEPRIMGTGLNLSPVVMLLSLATWGSLWGIAGMFLAVPLMVVLMIVLSHFATTRPMAVMLSADGELRD